MHCDVPIDLFFCIISYPMLVLSRYISIFSKLALLNGFLIIPRLIYFFHAKT